MINRGYNSLVIIISVLEPLAVAPTALITMTGHCSLTGRTNYDAEISERHGHAL